MSAGRDSRRFETLEDRGEQVPERERQAKKGKAASSGSSSMGTSINK
jgi:hypothetical protein